METSGTIGALAGALAKAQAELGPLVASKRATVRHKPEKGGGSHSYTYADLADALAACRATLNSHGIAVIQQTTTPQRNGVEVSTMLIHESGEWLRSAPLFMPVSATDAQAVGSAITYARRYQLLAVVGLAPEDDDGAKATAAAPKRWRNEQQQQPAKPSPADRLEDFRAAVDAKVRSLAALRGVRIAEAWTEACTAAGYDKPPGDNPRTLKHEDLRKLNDALKAALAPHEVKS